MLLHGLDFAAEFCEGFAANQPQHLGIAPLAMHAAGPESTFENAAF